MTGLPLRVPESHLPYFGLIRQLPDSEFNGLVRAATAPLSLSAAEVVSRIASSLHVDADVEALTDALMSLSAAAQLHHWPLTEVATQVAEQVGGSDPVLRERVQQLLLARDLRMTAKAISLANETERQLHTFRVVTDLRPVFEGRDDEDAGVPVGMMVMNHLRLDYVTEAGTESILVALSEDDAETLGTELVRASRKSAALRRLVADADLALYLGDD